MLTGFNAVPSIAPCDEEERLPGASTAGSHELSSHDGGIRIAQEVLFPAKDVPDGDAFPCSVDQSSVSSDDACPQESGLAVHSAGVEPAIDLDWVTKRPESDLDGSTAAKAEANAACQCNDEQPAANPPPEDRADARNDTALLMRLAERVRTIRAPDGRYYAAVPVGEGIEYHRLGSDEFRRWLFRLYHEATGRLPRQVVVADVVAALRGRAEIKTDHEPVFLRVARDESEMGFLLDLGDSARRAVRVSASGWDFVDNPGVPFWRPPGQRAFPTPERGAAINLLRKYINIASLQWPLLVGWLTAALQPVGPYPILVLTGEQGSAKTTLAQVCRKLVDPHATPLRSLPKSERDLMVSAHNNWLLAFDNISSLAPWQSDALCRLSTGGGLAHAGSSPTIARSLARAAADHSERDRRFRHSRRPGGPQHLPVAARHPARNAPGRPKVLGRLRSRLPGVFGALLDAAAGGVRLWPEVKLDSMSRMADLDRWGEAVVRGLGLPAESFTFFYHANRRSACVEILEQTPVAGALAAMLAKHADLEGTPSQLFQILNSFRPPHASVSTGWPKAPNGLSKALARMAPQLREIGIVVAFGRPHEGRVIRIARAPTQTPEPAVGGTLRVKPALPPETCVEPAGYNDRYGRRSP